MFPEQIVDATIPQVGQFIEWALDSYCPIADMPYDVAGICRLLEKPWKWQDEWEVFRSQQRD